MVIPALPELQAEFHADPADATWLLTAFLLTSSVATPLLGRLGDMHGKERWLLISLAIFGAGRSSPPSPLAGVMIAGRADPGRGRRDLPARHRHHPRRVPARDGRAGHRHVSAMFGIGGGSGSCSPGSSSTTARLVDLLALGRHDGAAALATWRWVPESPVRVRARIDWVGGVLLSLALSRCCSPISEGNTLGLDLGRVLGLFAAAVVLTGAWGWWELRVVDPLVDLQLMRRRAVWTTNVAAFAIGLAMFGSFVLIPQLVQTPERAGYGFSASVTASGLFLLPSAVVMLFAGPVSGRLGTRFGSKLPLAIGAVFASAGTSGSPSCTTRGSTSTSAASARHRDRLAFAAMANLTVEAVR
jgi:MFS family permease